MPSPASTAERLADLTALGFNLRKIDGKVRGERFVIKCGTCKRFLESDSSRYGDLHFVEADLDNEKELARDWHHNLELDRVWLECRMHKAFHRLSAAGGTEVPRGRAEQSLLDTISGIHDLYASLRASSSGQRDVLVKELAFFLRGIGYGDAADALELPR